MQKIPKDVLYFEIGADNAVTRHVALGETFEIETQINSGPWIDRLPPAEAQAWKAKLTGGNPSSGCIHVTGIKAGDILSVELGEITLDPMGYTQFGGNNGAMPGLLEIGRHEKLVEISNGAIQWNERLSLPVRPMLGYVGVAPKGAERHHHGWGGYWGGNMDAQEVTTGTTLHLRTHHDGALLHIGDMHAMQGDGEICGAGGIEASGRVKVTCRLHGTASEQQYPRFETATHIGAIATGKPAESAFHTALIELLRWLKEEYQMAHGDAYLLLGQVLEARCTQFVNPSFTYVAKIEKKYLR
jgi:amidase